MNASTLRWLLLLTVAPALARADGYSGMLDYLDQTRLEGRALSGASGAIAINQAAGDFNQQANLRSLARGQRAVVQVQGGQQLSRTYVEAGPLQARASIEGQALGGANGIASINQASGHANTSMNVVGIALAQRGISESDDAALAAASVTALAGGQGSAGDGVAAGTRQVGVSASALQGFNGVLQLNQIAGIGNDTANTLCMAVKGSP